MKRQIPKTGPTQLSGKKIEGTKSLDVKRGFKTERKGVSLKRGRT